MRMLSTGQPSTLGTYRDLAEMFGPKCEEFFEDKIQESPIGETEEVLADEQQMMMLMVSMMSGAV